MQKLPLSAKTDFDIPRINQYIEDHQSLVYIFYTRIIDVELPQACADPGSKSLSSKRQAQSPSDANVQDSEFNDQKECLEYMVKSSIMRFKDLKLLGDILG